MAGEVVNSSFVLLSKFGASRQESASKTATSHIRKTLCVTLKNNSNKQSSIILKTKSHNYFFNSKAYRNIAIL